MRRTTDQIHHLTFSHRNLQPRAPSAFLSDLPLKALIQWAGSHQGQHYDQAGNITFHPVPVSYLLSLYNVMFHAPFCGCLSFLVLISVLLNFPSKDQICLILKVKSRVPSREMFVVSHVIIMISLSVFQQQLVFIGQANPLIGGYPETINKRDFNDGSLERVNAG